ncbi:MAG: HlyD family efflux transporter periplasmic adaptor subunit [Actinobacteria bacterium]|nr:HlyD family efflux transporter periplasmic adaptor subunit [Actinomycetota bacterium]
MPSQDKNSLFRREALASLNDIDELDRLVTVTHPRAWLTLGAVAALIIAAVVWASVGSLATTVSGEGILLRGGRSLRVITPSGGQLASIDVGLGDRITVGQKVATVVPTSSRQGSRATGVPVVSPYSGVVTSLQTYAGQYLSMGAPVVSIEPTDEPLVATLYVPDEVGMKIRLGQQVQIIPATISVEQYGYLEGQVVFVAALPSTPESMNAVLQNALLVQQFSAAGPTLRVEALLIKAPGNPSGYAWSSSGGPSTKISSGTVCSARIVLTEEPPITYAFPTLRRYLGGQD